MPRGRVWHLAHVTADTERSPRAVLMKPEGAVGVARWVGRVVAHSAVAYTIEGLGPGPCGDGSDRSGRCLPRDVNRFFFDHCLVLELSSFVSIACDPLVCKPSSFFMVHRLLFGKWSFAELSHLKLYCKFLLGVGT